MTTKQSDQAAKFRGLHDGPDLLVLPNAWDAGSARLTESLGAKAIATSSAAVAWAHGYPDGNSLPVPLLIAAAKSIARLIRVPLSLDVEGGYSTNPVAVGEVVAAAIDAGAVGINIEDARDGPDILCAKIEVVRNVAAKRGVELFVNARTDVYLFELVARERRVAETLARAKRYRAAGADGLFVPAVVDLGEIRTLVSEVGLPINVLVRAGLPDGAALKSAGVRRLSAGSTISQQLWIQGASLAKEFLTTGRCERLFASGMSYGEINALMR